MDQIVIVELAGRVSMPDPTLRRIVDELVANGDRYFIVSMANVSYLDNSGLGQLCWMYTMARKRGGDMKLVRPTSRIKKLLHITKLDTVFESFDTESEAIASMPAFTTSVPA